MKWKQKCLLLVILFLLGGVMYACKSTRHNGIEWYNFGPAVIMASDIAVIELIINKQSKKIQIVKSEKLEVFKEWLFKRIKSRLNTSPVEPNFRALEFGNCITLYVGNELKENNRLIEIPLTPITLGVELEEFHKIIKELSNLIGLK